ncbi:hypothetical protein MKW94_005988 [Papaver nudicaule]|uniref:rRNA-processing protein FYV7 n=1 Tax=Papaver nudicaule TaxID=74823 RepID=A0AA41VCH3_PAPNU|nr:hypothetical protein [Papaver nudicaule]
MKNQPSKDGKKKNFNQKKRLGGKGLSLEAFANAKSKIDGYNPSLIKKQREFYKNAKCVNKYKKSLKQQNAQHDHISKEDTTKLPQEDEEAGTSRKMHNKQNKGHYQSLREVYEKKHEEEEKAKAEKEAMLQARNKEREVVESKRKERRENMFKRTRSGQPIMKYRIEHILQTLQDSAK